MSVTLNKTKGRNKSQRTAEAGTELKEYETRLELLYDVAHKASSVSEVTDLLREIPYIIQQIIGASASVLFLIDEDKKEFCLLAAGGGKSNILEQVQLSLDSGIAGWVARNNLPVIVNDVPQDERHSKEIDEAVDLVAESIIAAPLVRGTKVIGVIEMINKDDGSSFDEKDLGLLTEFASTEALILLVSMAATLINNFKLCQSIQDDYKNTIETLVTFADAKDPYAYGHSRRVKEYALLAAYSLKLSPEEMKAIEFGALLHDIGKIGIDDRILRKPGPLSADEWYVIRKHALRGANIVSAIPNLEKATDIILYHHERYDGTGYPEGLKGEQIPIGARLVAVADAFDTMTTDHAYSAAISVDEALSELIKYSGTQFCPVAVEAFVSGFQKGKGSLEYMEAEIEAEEIIRQEAEENVRAQEAEELAKKEAKRAARERARREAKERAKREAEEQAKREAEEARKTREAEKLAKKEAKREAEEQAKREAEEARKAREAEELAKTEAKREAEEQAKREAEEARRAREAEELAKKEAKRAAEEQAKREAEEVRRAQEAEELAKKEAKRGAEEQARREAEEARRARETEELAKKEAKREAEEAMRAREAEELAKKEAKRAAEERARREAEEARRAREAEELAKIEAKRAAEERARREAEEARRAREAEKLAKKEAEQAAEEQARREAEEARRAREAEKLAKKEAKRADEEQARREAEKLAKKQAKRAAKKQAKKEVDKIKKADGTVESEHETGSELYEGDVELAIVPFESFKQTNQFRKDLLTIENLRVVSDSWSEDEGFVIVVSLRQPIALTSVLRSMPAVKDVYREDKRMVVVLKTSQETK